MEKFELNLSLSEVLLLIDSLECSSKHLEEFTFYTDEGSVNFLRKNFSLHNKLVRLHNTKRSYDFIKKRYYTVYDKDDFIKIFV